MPAGAAPRSSTPASASCGPSAPDITAPLRGTEELFLRVSVNGVSGDTLYRFVHRPNGDFDASPATLSQLGIRWCAPDLRDASADAAPSCMSPQTSPTGHLVTLRPRPGVCVHYDAARQSLALVVPASWLSRALQTLGPDTAHVPLQAANSPAGILLNYDGYASHVGNLSLLSASNDLRLYGLAHSYLELTTLSKWQQQGAVSQTATTRLDTHWTHDDAAAMVTVTAGDFTSAALNWSRSVRMAGLQIGRNDALQPYRLSTPMTGMASSAVLPSTVDLFINGIKQSSQSVAPGTFEINSTPSINGAGQAQMVITDITGAQRTVVFALYGTPQLLRSGASDWSAELGVPREQYGIDSFTYAAQPNASASLRYGVSNRITFESHSELAPGLQLVGAGGLALLGQQGGIINSSWSASRAAARQGMQWGAGYQWNDASTSLTLSTLRRTSGYRDLGSLNGADMALFTQTAFLGQRFAWAQLGLSWIAQRYPGQAPQRYVSASITRSWSAASVSLSLNRVLNGTGSSVFATLSVPLGQRSNLALSSTHSATGTTLQTSITQTLSSEQTGWGARASIAQGNGRTAQGEATYTGEDGQWTAGVSQSRQTTTAPLTNLYSELTGAVVWLGAHPHLTQQVAGSFALVDTDGVAGLPVRYQNRMVGVTDNHGQLLVNHLNAYQHNSLAIDTLALPADMRVRITQLDAVPESDSGVLAHFTLEPVLAVQTALRDARGAALPPGTTVCVQTRQTDRWQSVLTGYDGELYVENPRANARLISSTPDNQRCQALLPRLDRARGWVMLPALTCLTDDPSRTFPDAGCSSLAPHAGEPVQPTSTPP